MTIFLGIASGFLASVGGSLSWPHAFYIGLTFPLSLHVLVVEKKSPKRRAKTSDSNDGEKITEGTVVDDIEVGKPSIVIVPFSVFVDYMRF